MRLAVVLAVMALFAGQALADTPKHQAISANCRAFYPQSAKVSGIEGEVGVSFKIGADGRAREATVSQSSGIIMLDKAALDCVTSSRYEVVSPADDRIWQDTVSFIYSVTKFDSKLLPPPNIGRPHSCTDYFPENTKVGGKAEVAFTITVEGRTQDARLTKSTGDAALDAATLRCVAAWRYKAAVKGGLSVAVPWIAYVYWGQAPPEPVTGDPACWKAMWPKPEEIAGVTGPTIIALIGSARGEVVRDLHIKTSSGRDDLDHIAMTCLSRNPAFMETVSVNTGEILYYSLVTAIDWHKKIAP